MEEDVGPVVILKVGELGELFRVVVEITKEDDGVGMERVGIVDNVIDGRDVCGSGVAVGVRGGITIEVYKRDRSDIVAWVDGYVLESSFLKELLDRFGECSGGGLVKIKGSAYEGCDSFVLGSVLDRVRGAGGGDDRFVVRFCQ